MKLTLYLVKKNFIIMNEYIVIFVIASLVLPIFLFQQLGHINSDVTLFFMSCIFVLYFMLNVVLTIEEKYSGEKYLSTLPYTRKRVACAPYLFIMFCYLMCIIGYNLMLLLPFGFNISRLSFRSYIIVSLMITVFFGIYFPILAKYGYERTKIISIVSVVSLPYLIPLIGKIMVRNNIVINFNVIGKINETILTWILLVTIFAVIYVSMKLSIHVYTKKDL